MTEQQLIALRKGIGNKITLTGFQNPSDYPLSVQEIECKDALIECFQHGNWATNTAFVWQWLAFVQRSHGGDEWLTLRELEAGSWQAFESVGFYSMIQAKGIDVCSDYLDRLAGHNLEPTLHEPALG